MDITPKKGWRTKLHDIIYEADTPGGKLFDLVLFIVIIASILFVMLESVNSIDEKYHNFLDISEWVITILFTIEYIARIITVKKPLNYVFSFYGIIDLLSTIPKYISLIFGGIHALAALRALRLLRVFRILKLARYLGASNNLVNALKASKAKISVFLFAVLIIAIILGTIMYLVEGEENGFSNIPKSVYWCIVTLTTVGFGDIAPQTPLGQFIASLVMILGYGIIAVPTGIVSAEYTAQSKPKKQDTHNNVSLNSQSCENCLAENHKDKADYCYNCGEKLHI
ncbi:ion transporter [Jejuia pallidilutea]|uniref:Potassium voltage-gated channel subfamily KQ n=1 Tax=Jejuia pallidilutea TaxID=504487 RepID=A0A090VXI5_9FLAO|nr:ion transporter [Jejuia pallidilutea]GAL68678.1 potassium voltage-gated channel subfamily KQT [Jejuia pallidilutea]GAL72276.1 potassium voltage-gated channel subfamily KQT [Jejuia pallidilutea]GAL89245.1 potassium voltage-gated channel subfamily KQ [Jejuia pallidilutea]